VIIVQPVGGTDAMSAARQLAQKIAARM
jgi:hypothetical protein